MVESISFLGVGLIGAGLARAAVRQGHRVRVWNRTRAKAEAIEGASALGAPLEAFVGAERVHLAFTDDTIVDGILEGLGAAPAGAPVIIDHSTTRPDLTAARAARLAELGWSFLHAPVFMSPQMCMDATGMIVCSGPEPVFRQSQAALEEMTGEVMYLGEQPDAAAAYKLFGNALILTVVGGLADVFQMAREVGIEPEAARALFERFNPAGSLTGGRGKSMARGAFEPAFALRMARKDVRLMQETAGERPLAVLDGLAARMDTLIEAGLGDLDVGVLGRGEG